jgi:hypothetical protein
MFLWSIHFTFFAHALIDLNLILSDVNCTSFYKQIMQTHTQWYHLATIRRCRAELYILMERQYGKDLPI